MDSLKKKALSLTVILMVAVALLLLLVVYFQRKVDSTTIKGGVYNYFGETKIEYNGSVRLQYKEGAVTLKADGRQEHLDSTPLYDGEGRCILPRDYIWYDLTNHEMHRINHFAVLTLDGDVVTIQDGSKTVTDAKGFLYDGKDIYLFLENVALQAGDDKKSVPALSYAVSNYGNSLQCYDYRKNGGESTVFWCGEAEQTASFTGRTVVNLGTDQMDLNNGTWQLLMGDPQVLDTIE